MKERSRTEFSALNIFSGLLGYAINVLISFICRMVFVRVLAQEYLGISGLFSNILSMLSLSELGIGSAITYALYKPIAEGDREKVASLMGFYGKAYKVIGTTIGAIGICLMPFLDLIIQEKPDIPENLYVIYLLYLFGTASSYFFSYRGTILMASQRNYIQTSINYIVVVIQNILQIIFLVTTHDFMAYLVIQIACTFVTNILISRKAKKDYPYIAEKNPKPLSQGEKRELVRNVKALTVTKLSGILVNNTDNIVITYFNGLVTTGAASNYTLFTGMITTVLTQIFNGVTASVGNVNAQETIEKKHQIFSFINLANFWLYGWGAVGIAIVTEDLVRLCYGDSYVLSSMIPIVLAINFYVLGMQNAVWTYKSTLGLFRHGQYILLITAAINIAGDVYLGGKYGLVGIYAATIIARVLTNVWYDPYAVFRYGLKANPLRYFKTYLFYVLILVTATGVCWLLCSHIHTILILQIAVKMLICTIVPNGLFLIIFHRKSEFVLLKERCILLFKKIKKR